MLRMNNSPASLENMLRGFSLQIFQMVQRVFAPNRIATRSKPSSPPSILRICSTVDVTPSPSLHTRDKLQKYAATSRRNITTMSEQWTVFKERKLISFSSVLYVATSVQDHLEGGASSVTLVELMWLCLVPEKVLL